MTATTGVTAPAFLSEFVELCEMMRADRVAMTLRSPEHEPQKQERRTRPGEDDEDRLWCIVLHGHGCSGARFN